MSNQGLLSFIIQTIISLSVFSLFLAIFIDFLKYSKNKKVLKEKKSIVETGTMTLFFLLFYIILRSGAGVITIKSDLLINTLIIPGTLLIVCGCIINIAGRFNLGNNWANQIKIYDKHTLIQTGMYKFVRHPLYASIILMFYGACLVYRSIYAVAAVSVIFVPFMIYRARQEETLLIQRFPQYQEYAKRTGMFFPKIKKGGI